MTRLKRQYAAPVLLIVIGLCWLLEVINVAPKIEWIWTGAIAAVGVLIIAVGGLDKLTGVVGPFLIIASMCSLLRQLGKLDMEKEVPILTIVLGVLLLVVHVFRLPTPEVMKDDEEKD